MTGRYVKLSPSAWKERLAEIKRLASVCELCPRRCGVNRLCGERGNCGAGSLPSLVSYGPHHGEEACLSGWRGSGTLFFGHCNLHCVHCQNADISQDHEHARACEVATHEVARAMLTLQQCGCHNINWVSPTHQLHSILEALHLACADGLRLPVVYNTHGYDSLAALRLLDGIVDIYLPDLKYADGRVAERLGAPPDYPARARAAIQEMYRQVGGFKLNADGLAESGVLVRLLVLPEGLSGTGDSLQWLYETLGPDVGVNIMAQYHPAYLAYRYPELNRRLTEREYWPIVEKAFSLGFKFIEYDRFFAAA